MSSRAYHQRANDSKSLWNYTLSPGWSNIEAEVLRKAIVRYGCGCWQKIQKHFPTKNNGQLNLQTQRLFGQQSLAEWNKLHVDPMLIKRINDKKIVDLRKNGCIVNTSHNIPAQEKKRKKQANLVKWGIKEEIYLRIKVPVMLVVHRDITKQDKIEKLSKLYEVFYNLEKRMKKINEKERKFGCIDIDSSENDDNLNEMNKNKNKTKNKTKNKIKNNVNNENELNNNEIEDCDIDVINNCNNGKNLNNNDNNIVKKDENNENINDNDGDFEMKIEEKDKNNLNNLNNQNKECLKPRSMSKKRKRSDFEDEMENMKNNNDINKKEEEFAKPAKKRQRTKQTKISDLFKKSPK